MWWSGILRTLLVGGFLVGGGPTALAGWGLPDLNPFSSGQKTTTRESADSGWSFPKLPSFGGKANDAPGGQHSSKSMLTRTKETLFPWTKEPAQPVKVTGTRRIYQGGTLGDSEREKSSQSLFSSWFSGGDAERDRPMSPHEWLSQPVPE